MIIQYFDNEEQRPLFRRDLVNSILECAVVKNHSIELQHHLLRLLGLAWRNHDLQLEYKRKQSINKTASDSHRLRLAINALQKKDKATLDYASPHSTAVLLKLLGNLESNLANLTQAVRGEYKEITTLNFDLNATHIVNLLQQFQIPCKRRNDHSNKDELDLQAHPIEQEQGTPLPALHKNISTAMRCIMLALVDSGEKKLSWTTTNTVIKKGLQLQQQMKDAVVTVHGHRITFHESKSLRLYMLQDAFWTSLKI